MRKKYILLISAIVILVIIYVYNHPFIKSTNLENESLAGIYLMQQADKPLLEKELGKLTNSTFDKGESRLFFDNPPYFASLQVDKNNQVIEIFVGYPNKTSNLKFMTSRNIGSESMFSDVLKAYGNSYFKKTYRNFMGSGDGYSMTYVDKERDIAIEFGFNDNPYDDKKEEDLVRIILKKRID
jgi:hypothetical protein